MNADEMRGLLVGALLCVCGLALILTLLGVGRGSHFTYGRNPYRRICARCGQQQDNHCHGGEWKEGWWEPMGAIMDPDCKCHQAVPEQFRPATWMDAANRARAIARRDARRAEVAS